MKVFIKVHQSNFDEVQCSWRKSISEALGQEEIRQTGSNKLTLFEKRLINTEICWKKRNPSSFFADLAMRYSTVGHLNTIAQDNSVFLSEILFGKRCRWLIT